MFQTYFRQLRVQNIYLHTTCSVFQNYRFFLSALIAWHVLSMCFQNVYDFFLHNIQHQYIILNHLHLYVCMVVYLTMLTLWRGGQGKKTKASIIINTCIDLTMIN